MLGPFLSRMRKRLAPMLLSVQNLILFFFNATGSESGNSIHELKGEELLKCLHDVGTLAQVLGSFAKLVGDISFSDDFEMCFSLLFR